MTKRLLSPGPARLMASPRASALALSVLLTMPALGFADPFPVFNDQPIEFWIRALQSGNEAARANAASVLGRFGSVARGAVGDLIRALHDKSGEVRLAAIDALGMIGPDAAASAPALAKFLGSTFDRFEVDLGKHAALSLAKVQPNGGGPLIAALFDSSLFRPLTRKPIDIGRMERLSQSLNPQNPETKQIAIIVGIGQLFEQAAWDPKLDKIADAIEQNLKDLPENAPVKDDVKKDEKKNAKKDEKKKDEKKDDNKDVANVPEVTPIGLAVTSTSQEIKAYRDQIRIGLDAVPSLVGNERQQWRNIVKLLAGSAEGLRILGRVVAEYPQTEMAGIILAEW